MSKKWVRRPARSALRRRVTTAVVAVTLALSAASCTGGEKNADAPSPEGETGEQSDPQAPLVALPGKVSGTLAPAKRKQVASTIGTVVDRWFQAAYLGGDYPRTTFPKAFPGFTPGLSKQAAGNKALMSNAAIGNRIEAVVARKRLVLVDLLAPGGKVAGATVRFKLWFDTTGSFERRTVVKGTLSLSRTPKGGYQIFGYDVDRAALPVPKQDASPSEGDDS